MAVGQPSASSSAAVPSASTSAAAQNASKRAAAAAPALAATVDYAAIEAARKAAHEKVKKAVEDYMAFEHEERARKEREKQLQQAEQRAGEKAVWKRARIGGKDKVLLTMKQVIGYLLAANLVFLLLFMSWWNPNAAVTSFGTTIGLLAGLFATFIYYKNLKTKAQLGELLSMDPGLKGCQYLLGGVPSWISLTDKEKMEWLNKLLVELWPYYDAGICDMVKATVEPIMEQYRPPGIIKRIFFEEFTFGEAPIRVEGLTVKEDPDAIDMEVDVRWCGQANITLGIDLPIGGEFTRLTPKVTDIVFVATSKLILKPLLDRIPVVGAVAFALKGPPVIKYKLSFGQIVGGSFTTAPIVSFVNFIVQEVIVGMLVWPKRITISLLDLLGIQDPAAELEVERLTGRQQGIVKVTVMQAKELKSYDTLSGKSDPFVELFTAKDYVCKTKHIKKNLEPVWNESFYLPVMEKDEHLYLEVFDHDAFNAAQGLASGLQVWKSVGNMVNSKEFMGRAVLPLAPFIRREGTEDDTWLNLGKGEWSSITGPGKGEGKLRVGIQYRAMESLTGAETAKADKGILLVTIMKAHRLAPALKDSMKPTAVVKRVASTIQASRSASKMSSGGSTAGAGGGAAAAAVDKEPAATGPVAAAVAAAAPDNVAPVLQAAPPVMEGEDGKPKKNPWRKFQCFVSVKVGQKEFKTPVMRGSIDPVWKVGNKFTFYDVSVRDDLNIKVVQPTLGVDDELGELSIMLPDIVEHKQVSRWTKRRQTGYLRKAFELLDGDGARLEVEAEFLPYW